MNDDQLKATYNRDGFVHLPGFLSSEEVSEMRDRTMAFLSDVRSKLDLAPGQQDGGLYGGTLKHLDQYDLWFSDLLLKGTHIPLMKKLMGEGLRPDGAIWNNKPKGAERTLPHQDALGAYRTPPIGCTIWMALDVVDRRNGCLHYQQGSHLGDFHEFYPIPDQLLDFGKGVAVEVQPGDAIIHSAMTIHWTEDMVEQRDRHAVACVYWAESAVPDDAGIESSTSAYKEAEIIL